MASRKEEKERLRKEREERERQETEQAAKQRLRLRIVGAVGALVVIGLVAFLALGGDSKSPSEQAAQGLQVTPGPWDSGTNGLEERGKSLNLPAPSDTIYHVHSQLQVYVNGKKFTVPANIGIDQAKGLLESLHTHDESGIIHQEAVEVYPFTLGQFFTIWGVKFTPSQLGAYRAGPGLVLETYVNGTKVPNGPAHKMKSHDAIVVGFGKPGSFPKTFKPTFSAGE